MFWRFRLGTTFVVPADLVLAHLAMAMAPNLNLNLRKLFLFSFSFEENDKQKAQFSNECPQQSSCQQLFVPEC